MNTQSAAPVQEENPLGTLPVGRLLINFSLPAIISCLINSIYNIVDQIFIGQGVGYLGNAATTVVFPLMTILLAFSVSFGFILPINAPQNMVCMGTDTFTPRQFTRVGLYLTVIGYLLLLLFAATWWKILGLM